MKKHCQLLPFAGHSARAAHAVRFWAVLVLLGLSRALASAQAISPQFFGINYWNIKSGSNALTDPNTALTDDLRKVDLRWVRIGGARFDDDVLWKNPASYVNAISYARSLGAEPLVQVPIGLTKDELSSFVTYFATNNITVTYWAIGNEQDPADDPATTTVNEPVSWSAGTLTNKYGYTYDTWILQYKALAVRLKHDLPGCQLVGPDFRLFYDQIINDYYAKFLNDVGTAYYLNTATNAKTPLLDNFSFHFYADKPESIVQGRFELLKGLVDNVAPNRAGNGFAPLTIAVNEVNASNLGNGTTVARADDFRAGQFVAIMAKNAMQQGALSFIPWSIYESSANGGTDDYSLYSTNGSAGAPVRRSTMWHLAMLSNYRQANVMNGTKNATTNDDVVFLGMRGPTGYTVLLMNTTGGTSTTTGTTYTYRASLDNVQRGTETIRIALEGYSGMTRQLAGTIRPGTTHLYHLDASGNVLAQLSYSQADAAPQQQLSFNFVNKSTGGYARPLNGAASANITQYTGVDKAPSSLQWLLKPAAPGYYYLINQYTGNAMRPAGTTAAAQLQEDQVMTQEALSTGSLGRTYLHWSVVYTGSGGYYWLKNRASGKYLRPLNGSASADVNLTQHAYDAALTSEQWRFDQTNANNTPVQARGTLATAPEALAQSLLVYPNPATATLTLSLGAAELGRATLRDMAGKTCLSQALVGRTGQLDMQALPAGVYLLTVNTAQGDIRRKIVKQ